MGNAQTHVVEGIESLIAKDQIDRMVHDMADEINEGYKDNENLVLLCILPDAAMFMADLSRAITIPHEHRYVHITNIVDCNIEGKDVIIVDSGLTLTQELLDMINTYAPASVEVCTFLSPDVPVKYNVAALGEYDDNNDSVIVGYGLDYNEQYRGLPYIGELVLTESESESESEPEPEPEPMESSDNDVDVDDAADEDYVPNPEETDTVEDN